MKRFLDPPYNHAEVLRIAYDVQRANLKLNDTIILAGIIRLTHLLLLSSRHVIHFKLRDITGIRPGANLDEIAKLKGRTNRRLQRLLVPKAAIRLLQAHIQYLAQVRGITDPDSPLFPDRCGKAYASTTLYNHLERLGISTLEHFKRSGLAYYNRQTGSYELLADLMGISEREVRYLLQGYIPEAGNWGPRFI